MTRLAAAVAGLATAALMVASSAAAAAPSATTGPVTSVGPTTATISGTVNPNGTATSVHFQYGTSTAYGSVTQSANIGSGTSGVGVSATINGLNAGTTYHYRVVATNSSGTANGADGILTTSSAPAVVTGNASSITATSATLNGTVNPSSRSTTWYFEYGTSTNYGTKTTTKDAGSGTSDVAVSAPITGLKSGSTYHFRLVATSDAGTARGSDHTFVPVASPTVTTNPASTIRDTTATLNGSVNPLGQSTTAYFEYGTTTSYGTSSAVKSVGSGNNSSNVSIGVTGLKPGVTYHFRIVAKNGTGSSSGSDQAFTTTGPPGIAAAAATSITSSTATLNASLDSRGHTTTWYFDYGTTTSYGTRSASQTQGSSPGAHTVSVAIGALNPGTVYHFRLVASNSSGTTAGPDTVFTSAGPAVTVAATTRTISFRGVVILRGHIASGKANENLDVFAQRFGGGSFARIATVLTDATGNWSLKVRPVIATTYKAIWNGQSSTTITVGVRPLVSIRAVSRHRIATHVTGARSFRGRVVQLQRRLSNGAWTTIGRKTLNSGSSTVFTPSLRRGRSTLRIAFSVNQAGAGYLGGFSRAITVRR
jgi:phosphodiesterase/alkaline phosphatase D-like protein